MFFFYCDPHALSQWTSQVSALPPLKTFKCCIVQSCLVYYVLTKHALIIVAEHYFCCDTQLTQMRHWNLGCCLENKLLAGIYMQATFCGYFIDIVNKTCDWFYCC